jgi:uncharacterized membrane protein
MPDLVPVAPAAPLEPLPTQENRLLAAVSHLSFFAGFWLVAPIAVYVLKRKDSRFAAFHALQAALVQVLFGATVTVGAIGCLVLTVFAGLLHSPALAVVLTVVPVLALATLALGVMAVHVVAAHLAWQGRTWSIPVAGRLARAIIGADEGAAKAS